MLLNKNIKWFNNVMLAFSSFRSSSKTMDALLPSLTLYLEKGPWNHSSKSLAILIPGDRTMKPFLFPKLFLYLEIGPWNHSSFPSWALIPELVIGVGVTGEGIPPPGGFRANGLMSNGSLCRPVLWSWTKKEFKNCLFQFYQNFIRSKFEFIIWQLNALLSI